MAKSFAYYRTSSATNAGTDKDSLARQRAAVEAFARANDIAIVAEHYDAAVSGADPINQRPGFVAMLEAIAANGVRLILVETASRFARDIIVQETGWRLLQGLGIELVAVDSPSTFLDDTPTAKLIRQILGVVSEFEKANLVAKLKAARERTGRIGGRKSIDVINPAAVAYARENAAGRSLRELSALLADRGFLSAARTPFSSSVVAKMLRNR
jgi:DNA invertase Pin-like site-specific DNA recombinase